MPRWLDYIFILRPILYFPVWTYYLAGYWGGGNTIFHPELWRICSAFLTGLPLTLAVGSIFIFNQLKDIDTDRINGKLFLISEGIVPLRAAYVEAAVLAAVSLAAALLIGVETGLLIAVLLAVSGWCYNYPPFSWKNHPFMGIFTNAAAGMIIYNLGWIAGGGEVFFPPRAAAYGLAGAAVYLNTTLPDRQGDAETGKRTFGVVYGTVVTARWALILEICMIGAAALTGDHLLFICGLIMLPFFIYSGVTAREKEVVRSTKYSVTVLAAAVGVLYPLYAILIAAVFIISKWYYKKKFNLCYPSLKNE